jgi:hypothetical protein
MTNWQKTQSNGKEGLIARIRQRAFNLYQSRQLLYTEAVLVSLMKYLNLCQPRRRT